MSLLAMSELAASVMCQRIKRFLVLSQFKTNIYICLGGGELYMLKNNVALIVSSGLHTYNGVLIVNLLLQELIGRERLVY